MSLKLPTESVSFKADPNVVPMIDILLVLLIIFMMQIPLNRMAMDAQVPAEEKVKKQNVKSDQIVLELLANGGYAINTKPLAKTGLDTELHTIYDERPAKLMFVKVAPNRKYQEVIEAMDIARGAGVQVIGFVPPDTGAAKQ